MTPDKTDYNWPGTRILIVEDDEFSFQFFNVVFRDRGPEVIRARNGKEALQLFQEHTDIDLILMDIQMPLLDGYEVTRLIREKDPEVTIIAQTAFIHDNEEKKCLEAGCTDYISKPIDLQSLLGLIDRYLG